jgi:hypothetical protein
MLWGFEATACRRWAPLRCRSPQPVLDTQSRNAPELAHIVCYEGHIEDNRVRSDQQVIAADRCSCSLKPAADVAVLAVSRHIERDHFQRPQDLFKLSCETG